MPSFFTQKTNISCTIYFIFIQYRTLLNMMSFFFTVLTSQIIISIISIFFIFLYQELILMDLHQLHIEMQIEIIEMYVVFFMLFLLFFVELDQLIGNIIAKVMFGYIPYFGATLTMCQISYISFIILLIILILLVNCQYPYIDSLGCMLQ